MTRRLPEKTNAPPRDASVGRFQFSMNLVVGVGSFGGLFDLLAGLREKFFGASGMAAQIVVVVLLCLVYLLPSLLDKFLGCAHVSMAFTDVHAWLLREDNCAKREGYTQSEGDQQDPLHG
jgi:hypothetical protein